MPLIMRPPAKTNDDVVDAERLRQIARRKEQNRNAQRRLRERKEEYTMQLEVQLAELHRRSQTQEEESHFLREALARMRAENQTLAEQISMIHQAVPSTQTSHPLPQRASIDLGVDHFAPLNRNRNRSQSFTASAMPHFAFAHSTAPWATSSQQPIPGMHAPFGASVGTIAPGATHRLPFSTASPLTGTSAFPGSVPMPQHDFVEDVAMTRDDDASRNSSLSPASQRRDSNIISPFDVRAHLSRHGSGQTDLTLPSDMTDADGGSSSKIGRISDDGKVAGVSSGASPSPSLASAAIPSRTMVTAVGEEASSAATGLSTSSDDVMASCLESIHSLPQANAASQKTNFDNAAASWMSSTSNEVPGQLALSDFRNADLSNMSKPLGLTPGALGLSNMMSASGAGGDGWSISPWIHLAQTPSGSAGAAAATDMEHSHSRSHTTDDQGLESGMAFDSRKSLASRRGFSGSLKLESRAT
ncbi:Basic-leucine zipper domain protein [Kalmanozyma brasiliensis GHG001]|uniref:BZIP domain-containing protein n=1 Tax=Kalmanozyma brasiliensis (strain GHG001) TaxID=1365824 RepID=V5E444_KALBG|nr:Basic-leucine zipper domain protein [Kalmanozyma brasiliensis GHG001]EST04961.1 Basic-leucine zipper domain protein [Kalmanozyma brasiliensis GHG001]